MNLNIAPRAFDLKGPFPQRTKENTFLMSSVASNGKVRMYLSADETASSPTFWSVDRSTVERW